MVRGTRAWQAGRWDDWRAAGDREEARLASLPRDTQATPLGSLLPALLDPPHGVDRRAPAWTRLVLGHDIGAHLEGCDACFAAGGDRWAYAVRHCGVQERPLRNFVDSLIAGGFADPRDYVIRVSAPAATEGPTPIA